MATKKEPCNLEAEKNVLGCAFLSKNALTKISEDLYSDMFYDERNQKLFEAIKRCYNDKVPIDITTIMDELEKKKDLTAIGGVDYVS